MRQVTGPKPLKKGSWRMEEGEASGAAGCRVKALLSHATEVQSIIDNIKTFMGEKGDIKPQHIWTKLSKG